MVVGGELAVRLIHADFAIALQGPITGVYARTRERTYLFAAELVTENAKEQLANERPARCRALYCAVVRRVHYRGGKGLDSPVIRARFEFSAQ